MLQNKGFRFVSFTLMKELRKTVLCCWIQVGSTWPLHRVSYLSVSSVIKISAFSFTSEAVWLIDEAMHTNTPIFQILLCTKHIKHMTQYCCNVLFTIHAYHHTHKKSCAISNRLRHTITYIYLLITDRQWVFSGNKANYSMLLGGEGSGKEEMGTIHRVAKKQSIDLLVN